MHFVKMTVKSFLYLFALFLSLTTFAQDSSFKSHALRDVQSLGVAGVAGNADMRKRWWNLILHPLADPSPTALL